MFRISPTTVLRFAKKKGEATTTVRYKLLKTANNLFWESFLGATLDTSCSRVISVTSNVSYYDQPLLSERCWDLSKTQYNESSCSSF